LLLLLLLLLLLFVRRKWKCGEMSNPSDKQHSI
jgi:hypothetical protein